MNKKFSLMLPLIFCALLAQAQDTPPDANWESDPLDVLEPQQQEETSLPTVPEFTEVPLPGQEQKNQPSVDMPPVPAPEDSSFSVSEPATQMMQGSSEPDYSKESEFHRIYKTYNEQPTPVEAWESAVGARSSEIYQVQKGDTLSGISTVFFGDPLFWPKIWSLNNNKILNPHEIDPGMAVQFFPGSMEDAPTLGLGDAKSPTLAKTETGGPDLTGVEIPKAKKRTTVLKSLPASLPLYKVQGVAPGEGNAQLQMELTARKFPTAMEYLEYYIADGEVSGVGKITATELGMDTAGDYQYVYVRLENNSSKDFIVQKNVTQLTDPAQKSRKGQMVEIQGQIEVLDKVNDQENVYRAIVKKTIQPLEVGSFLVPGKLPMINPAPGSITSGVSATVMGGQFDRKRALFGSNSIIFLDSGSSQGLQEGQNLAIYANERLRNKKSGAVVNDRVIGNLKIVRVSNNFATAYVTKATDDITVGDYAGSSSGLASNSSGGSSFDTQKTNNSDNFEEFDSESPDAVVPEAGSDDSDLEL